MKKIFFFFMLIIAPIFLFAQTQDMQKQMEQAKKQMEQLKSNPQYQAAMKKAQQAMQKMKSDTAFQRQMKQSQLALDSAKKNNPTLSNIQMPDLNKMQIPQIPNIDSIEHTMDKASQQLKTYSKAMDQAVPKLNAFHHAGQLQKLSQSELISLANSIIKTIKSNFGAVDLHNLNVMLKDSSINIAGTGAFLLASGASKNAALFLICNGILKDPKDPWAINDLGVYYRDQMDYEKALQCYFYANELDTEKNTAINTNIGWASAYYGDFDIAKKYFDKALAVDNNFTSANEGEAMIAYAKGDIAALFHCLAKEIKYMGVSGGSSGPSDAFGNLCGGIISENNTGNLDNQATDPNNDHTFDNPNPNDGQDPPPGADVDDINYRRYKKIFINDPKQIWNTVGECSVQGIQSMKELKQRSAAISQKLKTLKPLVQAPYKDGEGNLVYPNSFSKYVELFDLIDESFEKRTAWYISKLEKKLDPLRKDVINHDADMQKQYINALLACGKLNGDAKDACVREVQCTWIPKMYKSKNSDLDAVAKLWDDYYNNTANAIQWYIDASAPFISRVHEEGWNQYLNMKRELAVRKAIISAYGRWGEALGDITSPVCAIIQAKVPDCPAVEIAGVNAPDPFSKKPKHIKEFEGPCYDIKSSAFGVGLSAEQTCHATTISFEAGPLKLFYTHVDDQIYAQNHEYTNEVGTTISASKDVDIVKLEGKDDAEQSIVSAGAGVEGSVDLKFDNNWNFTSGSSSVSASANIAGINMGGISATRTVEMVAGQLNVNPLSVTTTAPLQ